jgi:hypothetical protein
MSVSSVVDCGFDPRSVQAKENKISIYCLSAKHAALRSKKKNGWVGISLMCWTVVSVNWPYKIPAKRVVLAKREPNRLIENYLFSP